MTWSQAFTRELRWVDFAIGALLMLVIFTSGFLTGASIYRAVVLQQGAVLDAAAARHCIWLDPPPRRP